MSIPTLFGLDPFEIVDGNAEPRNEKKEADVGSVVNDKSASLEVPSLESVTYVDHGNPFAFVGEANHSTSTTWVKHHQKSTPGRIGEIDENGVDAGTLVSNE